MRSSALLFLLWVLPPSASLQETRQPEETLTYRQGKDYALLFAVKNYTYWKPLSYPIDDADSIAKDLRELYGFQVEIVRDPSKAAIQDKLLEYGRRTYPADGQLLVFFSGHGAFFESTKEGFIIPKEGKLNDPYQDSYLPHDRLKKAVDAIPCNHILLAIDACFSGTIDDRIAQRGGPGFGRPNAPGNDDLILNGFISEQLRYRSRFYITSGGKEQTPDRSQFARQILEALRSTTSANRVLTFSGLCSFLERATPLPRAGEFGTTEPGVKNFLFIRSDNRKADTDGDGIPDSRDECPTLYAKTSSGCPDADEDGIPDNKDRCKYEPGPASNQGCPLPSSDRDNDGIPDAGDACPDEKGLARFAGCPDTDGDGIPDKDDACPRQAGPPSNKGCPTTPSIPSHMALVKGAPFQMGDVMGDKEESNETVHSVTLSDFLIGKTEVTFEEYDAFCTATGRAKPGDEGWGRGKRPVINVSWEDAIAYCNWRSKQEGLKEAYSISGSNVTANWQANGYRLPTEAEWEYAARQGGQKVRFGNGKNTIDPKEIIFDASAGYKKTYSVAGEYRQKTVAVGSLNSPNALGLHDMSGNVWEWCWDWYGTYPSSAQTNPKGPSAGSDRVLRGGSWSYSPQFCRVAYRGRSTPGFRDYNVGFRLARTF